MANVETTVKTVKRQRQSRSMTIAANFQSPHSSCLWSSTRILSVTSLSSCRISFNTEPESVEQGEGPGGAGGNPGQVTPHDWYVPLQVVVYCWAAPATVNGGAAMGS